LLGLFFYIFSLP